MRGRELSGPEVEQGHRVSGADKWVGHNAPVAQRPGGNRLAVDEREQDLAGQRPRVVEVGDPAYDVGLVVVGEAEGQSGFL